MKVIIPAGGYGTRLRPLTYTTPKVLLPLGDSFVLKVILEHITKFQFIDEIIISTNKEFKEIEQLLGSSFNGVKLTYIWEKTRLGGVGCIKNAAKGIDEDFIVYLGDNLTSIDLAKLISFHKSKNSAATVMLVESDTPWLYGVVITDEDGLIKEFLEKPDKSLFKTAYIGTGIYVFTPESMNSIKENEFIDHTGEIFPKIMSEGKRVYGYKADCHWLDIGNPIHFLSANEWYLSTKNKLFIDSSSVLDKTVSVSNGSTVLSGVVISKKTTIKKSMVFKDTIIGENCEIVDSIIAENSSIGNNVRIVDSVIGPNVIIEDNCTIYRSKIWPKMKIISNSKIEGVIKHQYLPVK